jgi:ADP-ribose pyrophosphatase YjhB (NUDIX family)
LAAPVSSLPRIRVAALLTVDDRVVLVRHRKGDREYHLLPGGGVDWGESLATALVREVAEETGLTCTVGRPLVINDTIAPDGSRHVVNITFACDVLGGELAREPLDERVICAELVPVGDMANLDLRPPIADALVDAIAKPASFEPRYAGSLFVPED